MATLAGRAQVLPPHQVLARLKEVYGNDFQRRISERAQLDDPRCGPIKPNATGDIEDLGSQLKLEGYEELGLRALTGLMVLQSRRCCVLMKLIYCM